MNTAPEEGTRHPVPMWRSLLVTSTTGELQPIGPAPITESLAGEVIERKLAWAENHTSAFAADLLNAAFMAGAEDEARAAAEFILSSQDSVASTVKNFASFVLSGKNRQEPILSNSPAKFEQVIRILKSKVRDDLRDSISWLDLARLYATMGAQEHALRSVSMALALAPDNRFILRGASRFFVHRGEPDVAHRLLRKSPATPDDPWLVSTEIAVAGLLKAPPKFYKKGLAFLESLAGFPQHISELASGLGTLELASGSTRKAKKLFSSALVAPNDNALAQVGWAARHMPGFEFSPLNTKVPFSYEAMTQYYMQNAEWDKALEQAVNWLQDQIFSSRPAVRASYLAAVHKEDYQNSELFARQGIRANPEDFMLRNNLIYALAKGGKVPEAKAELARVAMDELKPQDKVVYMATAGLICFEENDPVEGRKLYRKAIETARDIGAERLRVMATMFWALEEHDHKTEEHAHAMAAALDEARHLNNVADQQIGQFLLSRIKAAVKGLVRKTPRN